MPHNPNLPEFLGASYLPDHEKIPGYLSVRCRYEKQLGWEKEGGFTFQYLDGQVFFRVYPSLVQFPLGEAATVEEAIKIAWQFLKKWLSWDLLTYGDFQSEVAGEILRLEEEQRKKKEREGMDLYYRLFPEKRKRGLAALLEKIRRRK